MPMGMIYMYMPFLGDVLSYLRRFLVVYLTFKVMLRPQIASKQLEVYAFSMSIYEQ